METLIQTSPRSGRHCTNRVSTENPKEARFISTGICCTSWVVLYLITLSAVPHADMRFRVLRARAHNNYLLNMTCLTLVGKPPETQCEWLKLNFNAI